MKMRILAYALAAAFALTTLSGCKSTPSSQNSLSSQEISILGKPISEIDFSQAVYKTGECPDNEVAEYVSALYWQFLSAIGWHEYPDEYIALSSDRFPLIAFAIQRIREGWGEKNIQDYPVTEIKGGNYVSLPAKDIAACMNHYFAGMDAYALIKQSKNYTESTDTVVIPNEICGGSGMNFAISDVKLEHDILTITIYQFPEEDPGRETPITETKHITSELRVRFYPDHYQYLTYVKK